MKRRGFLLWLMLMISSWRPALANPFLRVIGRIFFRSLARRAASGGVRRAFRGAALRRFPRGAGGRYLRSGIHRNQALAAARRSNRHPVTARMQKLFGGSKGNITDLKGKHIGRIKLDGDRLLFQIQGRQYAFAQMEADDLVLYRGDGIQSARFRPADNRVIVTDHKERYLGQFIQETIQDQIVETFIDALGNRNPHFVIPEATPGLDIAEEERTQCYDEKNNPIGFSTISEGVLLVFDPEGRLLSRGVMEESTLIIYDPFGEKVGSFTNENNTITAYDETGQAMGHLIQQDGKSLYLESGASEPTAWIYMD